MRAHVVLVALSLIPASLYAQNGSQGDRLRAQVRTMLSGVEDSPSDAQLARLGPRALPVLISLYNDRTEPAFVRFRAVGATAAFPVPATRTFLTAVADQDGQSDLIVRRAVLALARGFGPSVTRELVRFLSHDESVVREAAARSLGESGGPRGVTALRARLRVERDEVVREAIERALSAN